MTMAIFDWTKQNPNARVLPTKKKLYKKYLYKLKYLCPFGRTILDDAKRIDWVIDHRIDVYRSLGTSRWAFARYQVDNLDRSQLKAFRRVHNSLNDTVKMRVEEPYVTFYTIDEESLKSLVKQFSKWRSRIVEIMLPDESNIKMLDEECILVGPNIEFKYKIVLKSGIYQNKPSLANYLNNLGDKVKLSPACSSQLSSKTEYLHGTWFYTSEEDLGFMLNLIEPNSVTNIHRLVKSEK